MLKEREREKRASRDGRCGEKNRCVSVVSSSEEEEEKEKERERERERCKIVRSPLVGKR